MLAVLRQSTYGQTAKTLLRLCRALAVSHLSYNVTFAHNAAQAVKAVEADYSCGAEVPVGLRAG